MPTQKASAADRMFHIGELAERVGLSLRTVRYYEEQGLLTPEKRTEGGFRLFTDEHVERLLIIKQMKPLGFALQEMRDLLTARDTAEDPDAPPAQRDAAAQRLGTFAVAAAERCDQLRGQLEVAEAFARQLRTLSPRAAPVAGPQAEGLRPQPRA